MSKEAFVDLVTADQPDAPAYFTYDAVLNSRERPTLNDALSRELKPLALEAVLEMTAGGAQLLDTRDPIEFAAAHLRGSINIGLIGQYATWAGTVLSREQPIVVVADPGAEAQSAMRLGRIGFDHVAGYLDGGLRAADGRADLILSTERLAPELAASRLASPDPPVVVDVRNASERARKRVDGSFHLPLGRLSERVGEIPADRAVIVYCAGGYRSSIAASLLQRSGRTHVSEIAGGIGAWEGAGLPVVAEA